ncbi:hypothetical protein ONE63_007314 [Megalurothrips usitatus]|uniref:Uncharacterized protein n=1 Tax=Megalurothrips usitatus TaxID=439358 RepID=A0AAV7XRP8_9NEOP|nr:hypothetical protein ONE63_007314 [Megalurothrips usitatus]
MFDSSYKDEGFSAFKKIKTVNHRLFNVTPPHFVDRLPDPVDKIIYWKASVLRAFLFHFSLCILHDVLEPEYFEHFVSFVKAISILNSSSVSPGDIEISSSLLTQFVRFQILYGKRHMTHNIHMLLHVSANVDYLAPLWVTNCFKFEVMNGRVTQLVHGTRYAGIQVCSNLSVVTRLPLMVHNLNNPHVKDFCDQLRYKGLSLRVSEKISDNTLCVGELADLSIKDDWIVHEFSQIVSNPNANSLKIFNRLYMDKMLYVSSTYSRGKRISSYVKYSVGNSLEIGNIVHFVRFSPGSENPQYFAVVQRLQTSLPFQTNNVTISHVHQIHYPYVAIDVIPIIKLHTVLFKTDVSDAVYVSEPLNHFELE